MDCRQKKRELRKSLLQRMAAQEEEYCLRADREIQRKLFELREYREAETVFVYVSRPKEVQTFEIMNDLWSRGKTVGVPKCIAKGVMEVYEIRSMKDLEPGAYGILEPKEGCRKILPEQLSFILVPCLSCTEDGVRLGFGGGYYDRYLKKTNAPKAVVCHRRMMSENLPVEEWDQRMEMVISE